MKTIDLYGSQINKEYLHGQYVSLHEAKKKKKKRNV